GSGITSRYCLVGKPLPSWRFGREPHVQQLVKVLRGVGDGAAMICPGDFPQGGIGITVVDPSRVAHRNVAILLAVNQQYWDFRGRDRSFRRDLLHVETVLPAYSQECNLNQRPEDGSAHPGSGMKGLAHAVIGDFA